MKNLLRKLWNDDCGAILTAEYLTLGSVVVLGGVAGLNAMQNSINSEMQEFGNSVRSIRQTYAAPGFRAGGASTSGSAATDSGYRGGSSSGASTCTQCDLVP